MKTTALINLIQSIEFGPSNNPRDVIIELQNSLETLRISYLDDIKAILSPVKEDKEDSLQNVYNNSVPDNAVSVESYDTSRSL